MSVYFITAREIGRVKIGYSADPRQRFIKLRGDSGALVELEREIDGTKVDEAALHERFADCRLHGEWFRLTDEIEAFMQTLPASAPVRAPGKGRPPRAGLSPNSVALATGISVTHAANVLSGKVRGSWRLAIHIYRQVGWKAPRIAEFDDHTIDSIEKVYPWSPPKKRAA